MTETARKKQAAYMLPTDLVIAVRREAAEREVYPAAVAEEAFREYFEKRKRRRDREPVSAAS